MFKVIKIVFITFLFSQVMLSEGYAKGLKEGVKAPKIQTKDVEGRAFNLKRNLKKGPVVLVFYRGGWCPYCNLQLRNLQSQVLPSLKEHEAQLVAVSVDKLDEAIKTMKKENLGMTVISDPSAKILKAYNVAYTVPEDLVEKYKVKYKIDLEGSSGEKHHIIAVPAVYVINEKGDITFSYVNEDYKVRAQTEDILKALKKLTDQKKSARVKKKKK